MICGSHYVCSYAMWCFPDKKKKKPKKGLEGDICASSVPWVSWCSSLSGLHLSCILSNPFAEIETVGVARSVAAQQPRPCRPCTKRELALWSRRICEFSASERDIRVWRDCLCSFTQVRVIIIGHITIILCSLHLRVMPTDIEVQSACIARLARQLRSHGLMEPVKPVWSWEELTMRVLLRIWYPSSPSKFKAAGDSNNFWHKTI